ncbi:MAG: restriction endonuclease subunit S [Fibrobacter sp.]|nr:restriction endonuclease subunit S [Fibrobacter sp.]
MAIITTTNLSSLEFFNRFDGELYNPHLLSSFRELNRTNYELKPIGCFCAVKSGTTPSDRDDSLKDGPILFKTTDIRNNVLSPFNNYYHISSVIHNRMHKTQLKGNDVLLNIVGATLDVIGRSAIVKNDIKEANITQAMVFLRIIKNNFKPGFLFAYLNTKYAQDQIKRYARPTGQYNLNLMEVRKILVPEIAENIQSEIDELVSQSGFLQSQSHALYHQAEELLSRGLQLDKLQLPQNKWYTTQYSEVVRAQRLDSNHFRDAYSCLFEFLNSRFQCKFVKQFVSVNRRGLQPNYAENGDIMVVNSKHLSSTHINYDQTEKTTKEEFAKQQVAQIRNGDVLVYTTGAYIGLTNAFNSDELAMASNHVNILRLSDPKIDPNYLAMVFNSIVGQMQTQKHSRGSAQLELYPADIDKFIIPMLDEDMMRTIGEKARNSLKALNQSKQLLARAKSRVEELIEQEASKN